MRNDKQVTYGRLRLLLSTSLAVGLLGMHLLSQEKVTPESVHLRDEVVVQSGTLRHCPCCVHGVHFGWQYSEGRG